jgi:hypothetical protein
LTAKQIVAKNVKARGGLDAWRKIDTMVSIGRLETGNPSMPRVPFVLQQARPNKARRGLEAAPIAQWQTRGAAVHGG